MNVTFSYDFQSIFKSLPIEWALIDINYKYQFASEKWNTSFSLSATNLSGQDFLNITPYFTEEWISVFQSIIQEKEYLSFERQFNKNDGTIIWLKIQLQPSYSTNQLVNGIIIVAENITQQKQIELDYYRSEIKYKKLYELLPVGVSLVNYKTRTLLEFNDSVLDKLGYTKAEFEQLTFRGISVEGAEAADNEQLLSLATNGKYGPYEKRYYRKDGSICTLLLNGVIFDDVDDEKLVLSTLQDITEIKRKEDELIQLNQLLDKQKKELIEANIAAEQFNYVASHDLNEPLRMVTGFLELFQKKYGHQFDEKASSYLHFALDGGKRMQALIKDLLQYSRIGREKTPLELVDVHAVVKEVKQNLYKQIFENEAELIVTMPNRLIICAHSIPLMRLLQNLISNAIKFKKINEIPKVKLLVEELENAYLFSITDNGIGIPPAFQERIFDVFTRLSTNNTYSGTGIGLAICKKIVEKHQGAIWVKSEENQGATFYFTVSKKLQPDL
ncbi:MAG: PAS domain-containing sensor histidine kinase [Chitinophagaceae bacterium]